MPNFWHFGDSFAFNNFHNSNQSNNFGDIISKRLKLNYKFNAEMGSSNELIFKNILSNLNNFEENDVLFINWSFFSRSCYINDSSYSLESTNRWYDDNNLILNDYDKTEESINFFNKHSFLMDYILNYNFDITYKLFNLYVSPLFSNLEDKKISIYNLFIKNNDVLKYNEKPVDYKFNIIGNTIDFNKNYFDWLWDNKYMLNEEGHYAKNIQETLADEIMSRMNLKKLKLI
jgi:hypothetical protein